MSPKIEWADVVGGAKTTEPGAAIPGTPEPEVAAESPGSWLEKANTLMDNALEMIRKIDEFAGIYLQLKGLNKPTEGTGDMKDSPGAAQGPGETSPSPGAQVPNVDQIIALLETIIAKEGDIPLSKFAQGLRGQEQWLIKYAMEVAQK